MRKYVDAGSVLGRVSQARARDIAREVLKAGEGPRKQATHVVHTAVTKTRTTSGHLVGQVRREVTAQLGKVSGTPLAPLATVAGHLGTVVERSAAAGRAATADLAGEASTRVKALARTARQVAPFSRPHTAEQGSPTEEASNHRAASKPGTRRPAGQTATKEAAGKGGAGSVG
jgi:hypothetical protein